MTNHNHDPVPSSGDEAVLRPVTADMLDRPGSQGRRGQESPDTWPEHHHVLVVTDEQAAVALGIVDRPLTAVRPVEQPTNPAPPHPPASTGIRSNRYPAIPWASLLLMLSGQAVIGATIAAGRLPAAIGAFTTTAVTVAGLCLVAAELIHRAATR